MPIVKKSLSEQARNALLESIVSGKLAAGVRLTEESLSQEFGISRTPVREALAHLDSDGLIEHLSRGGYQVKKLDAAAVDELLSCRIEVELKIFEEYHAELPLQKLESLGRELSALEFSDPEAFVAARRIDDALHGLINESCGNRYWQDFHKKLLKQRLPYRDLRNSGSFELFQRLKDERMLFLQAILSGDKASGAAALRRHLENGRLEILKVIEMNIEKTK